MSKDNFISILPIDKQIELIENGLRKNFSAQEMIDVIKDLKPKLDIEASKRRKAGVKLPPGQEKFKVRDILASYLGISAGQVEKLIDIGKAIDEDAEQFGNIPERIEKGQSINYAHNALKNTIRQQTPTPNLPEGVFEVIEMDPPWEYRTKLEGTPQYKTMPLENMKQEIPKLPAHKDCILFMWATNPKLKEAMELMEFYGFEYKTNFAWGKVKDGKVQRGTGFYVLGAHELLLIGVKGSPGLPSDKIRVPSLQLYPTTEHSEKPDIFYDIIETYFPGKKKLSMFSRKKREGWTVWGDSIE